MDNISKAINIIQRAIPDVQIIYLFGSTGTPRQNQDSDLDLAVLSPKKLDPLFRFQLAEEIASMIGQDVDLIDLQEVSTVLRFQIVTTSKKIFCLDPRIAAYFEMMVYSMYVRFNDERRNILENIKKRGSIYNG